MRRGSMRISYLSIKYEAMQLGGASLPQRLEAGVTVLAASGLCATLS